MAGWRPTILTSELIENICEMLADGKSMRTVAKEKSMPAMSTMFRWLRESDEFKEQYEIAKQESSDSMVEEINEIADNTEGDTQRDRLRIDARKWTASKLKPKKYGDKIDHTTNGNELPTPILWYVHKNDSDWQDNEDEQEGKGSTGGDVS